MKFIDHNSPEKTIINYIINSLSYMDIWISIIVEGYIYEKKVDNTDKYGYREEYIERYGKKEGECKLWYPHGQLFRQWYYKDRLKDGECKMFNPTGELFSHGYYKEGKKEGEWKTWYPFSKILGKQIHYKDGDYNGEFKEWDEDGNLIYHKMWEDGEIVQDLLLSPTS